MDLSTILNSLSENVGDHMIQEDTVTRSQSELIQCLTHMALNYRVLGILTNVAIDSYKSNPNLAMNISSDISDLHYSAGQSLRKVKELHDLEQKKNSALSEKNTLQDELPFQ